jgi:hypothetical protein
VFVRVQIIRSVAAEHRDGGVNEIEEVAKRDQFSKGSGAMLIGQVQLQQPSRRARSRDCPDFFGHALANWGL